MLPCARIESARRVSKATACHAATGVSHASGAAVKTPSTAGALAADIARKLPSGSAMSCGLVLPDASANETPATWLPDVRERALAYS